jgi:hypothetical protein
VRGAAVWGVLKCRVRGDTSSRTSATDSAASTRGRATGTSRGVRSCSSSSVARTIGSAWNRSCMIPPCTAFPIATIAIP